MSKLFLNFKTHHFGSSFEMERLQQAKTIGALDKNLQKL